MITNDINTLFRKVFAKANSLKNAENTSDIDAEVIYGIHYSLIINIMQLKR